METNGRNLRMLNETLETSSYASSLPTIFSENPKLGTKRKNEETSDIFEKSTSDFDKSRRVDGGFKKKSRKRLKHKKRKTGKKRV